jgi:predicted metal-dependent hydrolase
MSLTPADPEFHRAIELFNSGEFYACHDVLEELWSETLGPERQFLQGLIHAAVSLFHFEGGNLGGARKMAESTLKYLAPYPGGYMGIDLARFSEEYRACVAELLAAGPVYPEHITLDPDRIPRIDIVADDQSLATRTP